MLGPLNLHRSWSIHSELWKELEPSYWTIRMWVRQADGDEGRDTNTFVSEQMSFSPEERSLIVDVPWAG